MTPIKKFHENVESKKQNKKEAEVSLVGQLIAKHLGSTEAAA